MCVFGEVDLKLLSPDYSLVLVIDLLISKFTTSIFLSFDEITLNDFDALN